MAEILSHHKATFKSSEIHFFNPIGSIMVSMFTSGAVDHGFESCQTKGYKIDIYRFSAKH